MYQHNFGLLGSHGMDDSYLLKTMNVHKQGNYVPAVLKVDL